MPNHGEASHAEAKSGNGRTEDGKLVAERIAQVREAESVAVNRANRQARPRRFRQP
jgi:hypothetical protein